MLHRVSYEPNIESRCFVKGLDGRRTFSEKFKPFKRGDRTKRGRLVNRTEDVSEKSATKKQKEINDTLGLVEQIGGLQRRGGLVVEGREIRRG